MIAELNLRPTDEQLNAGLESLRANTYVGRFALLGVDEDERLVQAYALMGRSEPSQRRLLVADQYGNVRAVASDKSEEDMMDEPDADLIYYQASASKGEAHLVTNGAQTTHMIEKLGSGLVTGLNIEDALRVAPPVLNKKGEIIELSRYEPDNPNYTPRIACAIDSYTSVSFAIVRKDPDSSLPIYSSWYAGNPYSLPVGVGYAIHTYKSNALQGEPLPSFDRDHPVTIPLQGTQDRIATDLWDLLDHDNRVALMVRTVSGKETSEPTIINRHQPYTAE